MLWRIARGVNLCADWYGFGREAAQWRIGLPSGCGRGHGQGHGRAHAKGKIMWKSVYCQSFAQSFAQRLAGSFDAPLVLGGERNSGLSDAFCTEFVCADDGRKEPHRGPGLRAISTKPGRFGTDCPAIAGGSVVTLRHQRLTGPFSRCRASACSRDNSAASVSDTSLPLLRHVIDRADFTKPQAAMRPGGTFSALA